MEQEGQASVEETRVPEPYVRQVEDHSRPAQDILADEQEARVPNEPPALFVP
jgi:hypothetical protein